MARVAGVLVGVVVIGVLSIVPFDSSTSDAVSTSQVVLSPTSQTAATYDSATVSATVTGPAGQPVNFATVTLQVVSGPDVGGPPDIAATQVNGQASIVLRNGGASGTDVVQASYVDGSGATWLSNQVTIAFGAGLVVAFGDSVAAGEGDPLPQGFSPSPSAPAYFGYNITQKQWTDSPDAYPAVLASTLGWNVDNFAISGACAGQGTKTTLVNCSSKKRPTVLGTELPAAESLGLHPSLVTLTVGADDVNFKNCFEALVSTQTGACSITGAADASKLVANITAVLTRIHTDYPGVPIEFTQYYSPLPSSVSTANSICSDGALAYTLNEAVAKNWVGAAQTLATGDLGGAGPAFLNQIFSNAATLELQLNSELSSAALAATNAGVAVTTVPLDFTGHDLCNDYPGGNTGWIFAPSVSATAKFGVASQSFTLAADDTCATEDAGCTTIAKSKTGKIKATGTKWSYSYSVNVNDVPHPTVTGQSAIATQILQASGLTASSPQKLTGVKSVVGDGTSSCAGLASGGVDCWGYGGYGELGNGQFSISTVPVAVLGVGGVGTLTGVASLTSDGSGSYCALLTTGGVDCWGYGLDGELGNGQFTSSAVPVAVLGEGSFGTLTGVKSLSSGDYLGSCALLTAGGVDCWGYGLNGDLGNGFTSTAVPLAVLGVGGVGTLTGVASLTSDGSGGSCALLTAGGVDCWGYGPNGALGNGQFSNSGIPVAVDGLGEVGTLTGVASVTSDDDGYCALLATGGVDCWGIGGAGELGNGQFSSSAVPVVVLGVGGVGTLTGVASVTSDDSGYCALIINGEIDCWGYGGYGDLGNGQFYTTGNDGSADPVAVEDVGGIGALTGVASVTSDDYGYCALLATGGIDCWGYGAYGDLGNGQFYTTGNDGSADPVAVDGLGGVGALTGVARVTSHGYGSCALLLTGGVDCWGYGAYGALGNGQGYGTGNQGSAVPVAVSQVA